MIILLYGPDTYRSRQRLHFYREGFKKKYDPSGLNMEYFDGEKLTIEDFGKSAGQMGFLAKKRFMVVENVISKSKSKKIQEELVGYLKNKWSDDNVLIFLEDSEAEPRKKGKKKTTAVKSLMNYLLEGKAEEFSLLQGEQLNKWIRDEVKKRGGRISDPAVLEMASLVGSDLWSMVSEIEKLINYKKGGLISAEEVKQMVRARFDENIFHLTDALAAKNAGLALKLLNDQIALGSHELYILTMLIRQFRILLQTRELIDQEPNYYTVASRLRIHPFVAQKAIRDARRFKLEELQEIYRQLLEIDIKIKSTSEDPLLLFDLLVTRVCRKA
ncbi:MAG: DNA polymerase III subunit delta [Patescibacteria group bacterium]|jgi:DNA polymerase-3 subunit delta